MTWARYKGREVAHLWEIVWVQPFGGPRRWAAVFRAHCGILAKDFVIPDPEAPKCKRCAKMEVRDDSQNS